MAVESGAAFEGVQVKGSTTIVSLGVFLFLNSYKPQENNRNVSSYSASKGVLSRILGIGLGLQGFGCMLEVYLSLRVHVPN